jgi:heptosyltransferase-2/heptosyltransferase-3
MAAGRPLHPFVFRFGRIGDMVMVAALLRFLHVRYGKPCHVVGAGPWNHEVFLGNPDVEECWTFPRHAPFPFTRTWPRVLAALHRTAPGPIYVCEYQYRQLPRIERLLAFSGIDHRRILRLGADPSVGDAHWIDCLLRFGRRTPAALSSKDYPLPAGSEWAPRLHIEDHERAERHAWLAAQGWAGKQLILIQPGNHRSMSKRRERYRRLNSDDKAWPIEQWSALIRKIHARMPRALILLRGSAEEVPMLQEVRAACGLDAVAVAGLGLRPTFALCEGAHSMISTDTGPAHAAAALGIPLVVVYGSSLPAVWLPRSPTGSPVLGVGGPPVSSRADQISVDAVFDAWCRLLEQAPARARRSQSAATQVPETRVMGAQQL